MSLSKGIWERTGYGNLSYGAYVRLICLAFAWTLVLVAGAVAISYTWPFSWLMLIVAFVFGVAGVLTFTISTDWPISLVGVSIMSIFLGIMIGPAVATYNADVVIKAIITASGVTIVMSVVGLIVPKSLESWGSFLLGALALLIVGNLARVFLPLFGFSQDPLGVLDWIGALVFTAYITYDWNRAIRLPKTVDNAIDTAGALILDWVNLFIYLLRIFADSDDD